MYKFSSRVANLDLFYDCSSLVSKDHNASFVCSYVNGTNVPVVYETSEGTRKDIESCKATYTVPVFKSGLDELNHGNATLLSVLRKGFELEYIVNFAACTTCENSGGRCGSFDAGSSKFVCHCPDGPQPSICHTPGEKNAGLIPGLIAVASVLGIVILIALFIYSRRRLSTNNFTVLWARGTTENQNMEAFLKTYGSLAPKRYSYSDIRTITNSLKDKLGEGGYGVVYKGKLRDGRLVAVKVLKQSKGNGEEFINEVVSISRTNHVNVVSLLGFCFEGKKRALVYDFLPNGSLEKFVYDAASGPSLPFETLFHIAVGIAKGLDYLHRGCNTRILHFDIKPHNILLDEEFCPKISDFGLARLCLQKDSTISMLDARGTIGYIAPEVFCRNFGGVSHKSDVYSYGMMVLDMVCGRKNISAEAQCSSELYFPQWIYNQLEIGDGVSTYGSMNDDEKRLHRKMILVSLWCIQMYPSTRPSMSRAVEMLEGPLESLEIPSMPDLTSPPRLVFDTSTTPQSTT